MKIQNQYAWLVGSILSASLGNAAIVIDTALVGHANNLNDSTGFGAVSYEYHIGTYEVTNSQYVAFLNATAATDTYNLYNSGMTSHSSGGINRSGSSGSYVYTSKIGFENKPVNYVSFWDAARFTNWLTSGDTETGVYLLNGVLAPANAITRDATAWANGGVAIASENEWYKAAYYGGSPTGADGDGYWLYPTQSNSITTADANYATSGGAVTDVGSYNGDGSYYGTFDQGGNVWEWIDTIISGDPGIRGGAWTNQDVILNAVEGSTTYRFGSDPTYEDVTRGFRVSSLTAIPETSAYAAILGLGGLGLGLFRRK